MRALAKLPSPDSLTANHARWTAQYVDAVNAGRNPPAVWNKSAIRDTLKRETIGRCAYCDAFILNVSFGDIEHYRPRSTYPALVVDWDNLTLACQLCNGAKSDDFDESVPWLNPYLDAVDEHLTFNGPYVFAHPDSDRGLLTVSKLELNSAARIQARSSILDSVVTLVRSWSRAIPAVKPVLADEIRRLAMDGEYFSTIRAYLISVSYPDLP